MYNLPLPSHHLWVLPSQDASTDDSLPTKVWHFLINSPNIKELVTTFYDEASQLLSLLVELGRKILLHVILPYVVACCVGVHFGPMPQVRVEYNRPLSLSEAVQQAPSAFEEGVHCCGGLGLC